MSTDHDRGPLGERRARTAPAPAEVSPASAWTELRRAVVANYDDLRAEEYVQVLRTHAHPDLHAVVRCACSKIFAISRRRFAVQYDGCVGEIIRCPRCAIEKWLLLLDWEPEPVGSA